MAGVFSKMISSDDDVSFRSIFSPTTSSTPRKIAANSKNPREIISNNTSKINVKAKWTNGYTNNLSRGSPKDNKILLDSLIENPSLAASVETDIKIDQRKKRLSSLKSESSYRSISSAFQNQEHSLKVVLADFKVIDRSFHSKSTIMNIILSTKSTCLCCCKNLHRHCLQEMCAQEIHNYDLNDNDPFQEFLPAYNLIKDIRSHYFLKYKNDIENDVRDKIKEELSQQKLSANRKGEQRIKLDYWLSSPTLKAKKFLVCKEVFCAVYGLSRFVLKRLIKEAKQNVTNSSKSFGTIGKNFVVSLDVARRVKTTRIQKGKSFTNSDYAAIVMPNTTSYKKVWF